MSPREAKVHSFRGSPPAGGSPGAAGGAWRRCGRSARGGWVIAASATGLGLLLRSSLENALELLGGDAHSRSRSRGHSIPGESGPWGMKKSRALTGGDGLWCDPGAVSEVALRARGEAGQPPRAPPNLRLSPWWHRPPWLAALGLAPRWLPARSLASLRQRTAPPPPRRCVVSRGAATFLLPTS